MKILIVEDEVLIRRVGDYLMECGYGVFEAGSGREALDLF